MPDQSSGVPFQLVQLAKEKPEAQRIGIGLLSLQLSTEGYCFTPLPIFSKSPPTPHFPCTFTKYPSSSPDSILFNSAPSSPSSSPHNYPPSSNRQHSSQCPLKPSMNPTGKPSSTTTSHVLPSLPHQPFLLLHTIPRQSSLHCTSVRARLPLLFAMLPSSSTLGCSSRVPNSLRSRINLSKDVERPDC